MKKIRIGSGAGYSGDRVEPALELAQKGDIQYLCFECLAERTIAIAQQLKIKDPSSGFDPLLVDRMESVLSVCHKKGIKIITNMGAANPQAGAAKIKEIALAKGLHGLKIAAVSGDDVLEAIRGKDLTLEETGEKLSTINDKLVSANAYLGAASIVEALKNGADVVITGRVADPALFTAPLIYEFGWSMEDWDRMGQATVIGHLLECAGQVTGGYFSDPGFKDVPGVGHLGFPIAEVSADGSAIITKVADAGGMVTLSTCKEQLLYEIHDPAAYFTPDVVADFSSVSLNEKGNDQVLVTGGKGKEKSKWLKVSIGYIDSYIGEGQISYAGPGAVSRGRLALEIVKERLELMKVQIQEDRYDLIGMNSLHGEALSIGSEPYEVRARVAARTATMRESVRVGNEVETLYTNGPAGGGGAWKSAREIVAMVSILIPESWVSPSVHYEVI